MLNFPNFVQSIFTVIIRQNKKLHQENIVADVSQKINSSMSLHLSVLKTSKWDDGTYPQVSEKVAQIPGFYLFFKQIVGG